MSRKTPTLAVPGCGADKILLHTCCAPCSSAIIEWMMAQGLRPAVYYCNPNIYPRHEYVHRRDECVRYAQALGLEVIEAPYSHSEWLNHVSGLENEPERGLRCSRCFEMRLSDTARYAAEHGFQLITTTLASSRWKNLDQINAAGQKAVAPYSGVSFWDQNWRKGGLSERRLEIIRRFNFYNQRYCGCEFSMPPETPLPQ